MTSETPEARSDFVRRIVAEDNESGKYDGRVHTRFPPEPNGYLHIGHAKSISLNFGVAAENGGMCNLRFDDTNPATEDTEFVESMKADIQWLGYHWADRELYASDYFEELYDMAVRLIKSGKAYVDSLSPDEIREHRGTLTEPGRDSPHRDRSPEESLYLFERMRAGEFEEGAHVLRAKIDMASPNLNLRDPVLYRIRRTPPHHRTGDDWAVYPMYDFAHGLSDSIEGITHSICTLEFEDHRPLYDWLLDELGLYHPQQIEFARLEISRTVLSKRRLLRVVESGLVSGWDDPRMPTISGMRRRGYTPESIRAFCERVGVAKTNSVIDVGQLEHALREDLNVRAERRMAVLDPLRVVIENYPEGQVEYLEAQNNPEDASAGTRMVPFSRVLYVEREDFMENPPRRFYRLAPGREVRLRYAYFLKCLEAVRDETTGEVVELRCEYDPETKGGSAPDGRRVRATLHWVSAEHSRPAEVRLFDHLFLDEEDEDWNPDDDLNVNPDSLTRLESCRIEPSLAEAEPGDKFQFERQGYFCVDTEDSGPGAPVFNRTVTLRDRWARIRRRG